MKKLLYFSRRRLSLLILGVVFIFLVNYFYNVYFKKEKENFNSIKQDTDKIEKEKENQYLILKDNNKYTNINTKLDLKKLIIDSDCDIVNYDKLKKLNSHSTIVNNYPYSATEEFILLRYAFKIEQIDSKIIEGDSKKLLYVFRVIDTNNKYSFNYQNISLPKTGKKGTMVINLDKIGTFIFFTKIFYYGTTTFLYMEDLPVELECVNGFYQFYFSLKPLNYPTSFTGIYKVITLENFNPSITYQDLDDKKIIYENCKHMISYKPPNETQSIIPSNIKVFNDCINLVKKEKLENEKEEKNIQWCLSGLENCYTEFKGDKISKDTCFMPDLNMNISPFCNPYINICEKPDFVIDNYPYYWRNYGKNSKCFGKTTIVDERQPVISASQLLEPIDLEEERPIKINCGMGGLVPKLDIYNSAGSVFDYRRSGQPVESDTLHCFTCQWKSDDKHYFDVNGTHVKFVGADPPANNQVYDKECPGPISIYGPTSVKCDDFLLSPQ